MLKLAHHFLSTLKNVDNVAYSGTESNTFNPLVASSSLARPTNMKVKTPYAKVLGVFFRPHDTTKTLSQHFVFRAVRRRC